MAEAAIAWPSAADFTAAPVTLSAPAADSVLALIESAARPLLIAGPLLANRSGRALLARIEAAMQVPTCIMESPAASPMRRWARLPSWWRGAT